MLHLFVKILKGIISRCRGIDKEDTLKIKDLLPPADLLRVNLENSIRIIEGGRNPKGREAPSSSKPSLAVKRNIQCGNIT